MVPSSITGFLVLATSAADAGEHKIGSLDIADPYTPATPKGATVGAGYMKITNNGTSPDRLISGSSDVAGKVEVHEMAMDKGVMKMRPLKGGLEIKPGETVTLKPGSFHVMFVGLKKPLRKGENMSRRRWSLRRLAKGTSTSMYSRSAPSLAPTCRV